MLNNLAKLSLFFFCVSVDKASKIKVTVNIGWQKLNDFVKNYCPGGWANLGPFGFCLFSRTLDHSATAPL